MVDRTKVSIGLKFIMILIAPIGIYSHGMLIVPDSNIDIESFAHYESILFNYTYSLSEMRFAWSNLPLSLLIAVLLCIPAMIFNYKITKWPHERPIKKTLIGILILSSPMFWMLFISSPLLWTLGWYVYYAISSIVFALNWVIPLMILLPLLQREASQLQNHVSQDKDTSSTLYSRIGIVLALCALFIPSNLGFDQYNLGQTDRYERTFISSSSWIFLEMIYGNNVEYSFSSLAYLYTPGISFSFVFCIWFAHSVLRYLYGKSSKRKCMIIGILGITVPSIFTLLLSGYSISVMIPLPFLFLAGVAILRYIKPIEIKEPVWQEPVSQDPPSDVKVPFSYMLRSKLRISKQQVSQSDWDDKEEAVSDTEHSKEE